MYFGDSQKDVLMVYRWGIKERGIENNDYYTHYIQPPTLDYIKTQTYLESVKIKYRETNL